MNTLQNFINSNKTSTKHKKYFEVYDEIFRDFIGKKIIFVEVGVLNGGSLEMWRKYFGLDCRIIGIDFNPECKKFEKEGIEIFIGDQSDPKFWDYFFDKVGKVDIILDDGGHTNLQQIITTVKSIENLNDKGLLVVEDTHTSYMSEFGNPCKESFINFSKKIIDDVNFTFPELGSFKYSLNKFIHSVRFFESFVVFYINRKKTHINSLIVSNPRGREVNAVQDFRHSKSIIGKLKGSYLVRKFKFLKKYESINFFYFKVLKLFRFFEIRKEKKKYKKYFE